MDKELTQNKKTENKTIPYFKPVCLEFGTLSCDGVRITGELHKQNLSMLNTFTSSPRPDVTLYPPTNKRGSYRTLATITYDVDITATIGIGLNASGTREDEYKCMFDFNLNKVAPYEQFWRDFGTFKAACGMLEIKRVDIALDIPKPREFVLMCKDKRKYALEEYDTRNKTEYLGRRSNVGYVKVYNKQIESDLPLPMTRVEVTTEFNAAKFQSYFPRLYIASDTQLSMVSAQNFSRCRDAVRVAVLAMSRSIARGENPLPDLYGVHEDTKKRIIDLLPVNPFPVIPYATVNTLLDSVRDALF